MEGTKISRIDTLYIGNVPPKASKTMLKRVFSFSGTIKHFDYLPKKRVVITFENYFKTSLITSFTDKSLAVEGSFLEVRIEPWPDFIQCQKAFPMMFDKSKLFSYRTLVVGNLPPYLNETIIRKMFVRYGFITDIHMNQKNRYAFITFQKAASAYNLLQHYLFYSYTGEFDYYGYQLVIEIAPGQN